MGINTGALYIILIMLILFGVAYLASGPTPSQSPILTGAEVATGSAKLGTTQDKLQLYFFGGATITPPVSSLCSKGGANVHPEAIIAYYPNQATAVNITGQIKIWVSDTKRPLIAPNEVVKRSSGGIKTPGDRAAKAPDGYYLEPAVYILPQSAEAGGSPHFPVLIHGDYDNGKPMVSFGSDPLPYYASPTNGYTVEYVWNVKDLGLTEGEHSLEFVVHDGSEQLAVKCVTIRVYKIPDSESDKNKIPI